jgi:acyl carrier protein
MEREQIADVVTKHIRRNTEGLDGRPVDTSVPMKELGLSSLDIVEVVSASMRELKIRVPRTMLVNLANIDELIDLLLKVKQEQQ